MRKLAIFASGSGTNAQNIIEYFKNNEKIDVKLVLSNKKDAFVLKRAKSLHIKAITFNRIQFYDTHEVLDILQAHEIDFIILAGFLWLMPLDIVNQYEKKMINIHPALLPKYGGKGMYGSNVHKAVIENKEKESGITIHYVNKHYDEGDIILQEKCNIDPTDTPDSLANKIHSLEYEHFPKTIDKLLNK